MIHTCTPVHICCSLVSIWTILHVHKRYTVYNTYVCMHKDIYIYCIRIPRLKGDLAWCLWPRNLPQEPQGSAFCAAHAAGWSRGGDLFKPQIVKGLVYHLEHSFVWRVKISNLTFSYHPHCIIHVPSIRFRWRSALSPACARLPTIRSVAPRVFPKLAWMLRRRR